MNILIVGAGRIGINLSKSLADENNDVHLIEQNKDIIDKINEKLDVKIFWGSGADPIALKRADVDTADLVLAVTTSDETNLVVCALASSFGAKRCIARVRSTSLRDALMSFGGSRFGVNEVINPELVAAEAVVKTVESPGASEVAEFADGRVLLRGFDIPEETSLCGIPLHELRDEDFPWPFLIVAIVRDRKVIFPTGETSLQPHDHIYVMLPATSLPEFMSFIDPKTVTPRKVVIFGATITGARVAKTLSDRVKNIILIEEDEELAKQMAGELQNVTVLNGTASEADILTECGIETADTFIAASQNDHANFVSSVLAKKMGAKTTIIVTQQAEYLSLIEALDIDAIINPHFLAVEQILHLVRGRGVGTISKMLECDAEAMELIPEREAPITQDILRNVKLPQNAIVGAVYRGSEVILASGDIQISHGEKVIVFCHHSAAKKLQALFTS